MWSGRAADTYAAPAEPSDGPGGSGEEVAGLPAEPRLAEATETFERVALADDFVEFLTLPAYELL